MNKGLLPFDNKIQKYLLRLCGPYCIIGKGDRICLAASDPKLVGRRIITSGNAGSVDGAPAVSLSGYQNIFLRYNKKKIAILLVEQKRLNQPEMIEAAKNILEISLAAQLDTQRNASRTDQLLFRILSSKETRDYGFFQLEAEALGIDLNKRRIALAIHHKNFTSTYLLPNTISQNSKEDIIDRWKQRISSSINGFFTNKSEITVTYMGNDLFALFKVIDPKEEARFCRNIIHSYQSIFGQLSELSSNSIAVGIGASRTSVAGLAESFNEAKMALEYGQITWPRLKSYHFENLGLVQMIIGGDKNKKQTFARKILGNLEGTNLRPTLEVFLEENLNLARTAKKLHVHRNTAIYRLNQINELLGLDPRIFQDAATLNLSLLVEKYLPQKTPND